MAAASKTSKTSKPAAKPGTAPAAKPAKAPAAKVAAKPVASARPARDGKQLTVTLIRSVHGQLKNIAASVRGLGLRRPHQSVTVADTVENRGMIHAAGHLLRVEPMKVEQN
jgi:large subunit ribosomal protein L30